MIYAELQINHVIFQTKNPTYSYVSVRVRNDLTEEKEMRNIRWVVLI